MSASPPIRQNFPSCRTCRSLACNPASRSPISSRKSVPRCAASNRPAFLAYAPVNAPRSYPNSSLSIKVPGIAGQFTFTNGPLLQGEFICTSLPTISFPVPLAPRINTGMLVWAACSSFVLTKCMADVEPKITSSGGMSGAAIKLRSAPLRGVGMQQSPVQSQHVSSQTKLRRANLSLFPINKLKDLAPSLHPHIPAAKETI